MNKNLFVLSLSLLLLLSCGRIVYHEFRGIEEGIWHSDTLLDFVYDASFSRSDDYTICMEVRVDASFPYKNLVARVECVSGRDSSLVAADTLCCEVFADNGHRNGATAGILYQLSSAPVSIENVECDTLLFYVSHLMDRDELCGVTDVGIKVCSFSGPGLHQSSEK